MIEHLYGREDGTGYIFIYDFSGIKISDPIWSHDISKILQELIQIAKNNDNDFVEYTWKKPTTKEYDALNDAVMTVMIYLKLQHSKK